MPDLLILNPATQVSLGITPIGPVYGSGLNVKNDFGAVGDGVTDDTTAINAARAAVAAAGGGAVFFPYGTYAYNSASALAVPGKTFFCGAGPGSILKVNNTGYVALSSAQSGISNLTIQRGSNSPARLVHVSAANCSLTNNYFDGVGATYSGSAVTVGQGGDGLFVSGNTFNAVNGIGLSVTSGVAAPVVGLRVIGNRWLGHLGTSGAYPISLNSSVTRFVIEGNVIVSDPTASAISILVVTSVSSDVMTHGVVANNYLETVSFGVEVQKTAGGTRPSAVSVTGNTMKAVAGVFGGVTIAAADNVTVSGNTLDFNGISGQATGIEIASSNYCTISGNTIVGNGSVIDGIILNGASHNTVTGNVINGFRDASGSQGIRLFADTLSPNTTDNTVTGNHIYFPVAAAGTAEHGIYLISNAATGHVDRNVIVGNSVYGNNVASSVGIRLNNTTSGTVDRNLVGMNVVRNCATAILQTSDTNTLLSGTTWNLS